jgi:hypothetical protein
MAFFVFRPMRALLLSCALAVPVFLAAQDASLVTSIRAELLTAANDTLRADALARLCFNLIQSEPDSARYYGDKA